MSTREIAGLYLDWSRRAFALEIARSWSCEEPGLSDLPMETGIGALLGELSAAAPALDRQRLADGSGYRDFLVGVERSVPQELDVHVIWLRCDRVAREWMASHPRFSVSHFATEELWADEIVRCLGRRSARSIRPLTLDLIRTFRHWVAANAERDAAFIWVRRSTLSAS